MSQEREHALSQAFMRSHPVQAAQVLESLPAAEAASLFEHAPARLGSTVLAAMPPHLAALCIEALDDAWALEVLAPMGTHATVAFLRHLPEPRRRPLIAGLPTAVALASTLLLGYAEDSLGAWTDPDVVILPADTRAADALERMRQESARHSMVCVTDSRRRLLGTVDLGTLLQAPESTTLATLMTPPAHVLTAHAPLSGTLAHPGWEASSVLPVLEPGEYLVGVIMLAMVISMLIAGLAGALVPILLRRIGQDPATASSIILTTVTDIVGFFSFLGIAALFAPLLAQVVT
ncbi:MAG: magnesium transporter [Thiobacillus sp.]